MRKYSLFYSFRLLIILVLVMLTQTLIISIQVYRCFKDFMQPESHVWYVCAALLISTGSLFTTVTLFNVCCYFIIRRVQCINLILKQLIFDEPISREFIFLNSNHRILSQEYPIFQQKFKQQEKTIKWFPLMKWFYSSVQTKSMHGNRSLHVTLADDSIKNVLNKMWPVKKGMIIEMDDISEMHHLDNLMRTFNLSDVKIILTRM